MNSIKCLLISSFLVLPLLSIADMPIVEHSLGSENDYNTSGMTTDQRIMHLEQQMQYLQQLSLSTKINELQQSIQSLQGKLDVQQHQIDQLDKQMRTFYSDLDKRVSNSSDEQQPVAEQVSEQTETTTESASESASESVSDSASDSAQETPSVDKEVENYQAAFGLVKSKQYADAIRSFQKYLNEYPKGKYSANVHYWLGQLYAISGEEAKAVVEFDVVINNYAKSNKVPDAMLALGNVAYEQSEWQQARDWWQKIVEQSPDTSAARIAQNRIVQLDREGH